jgi:hypothetical protein
MSKHAGRIQRKTEKAFSAGLEQSAPVRDTHRYRLTDLASMSANKKAGTCPARANLQND